MHPSIPESRSYHDRDFRNRSATRRTQESGSALTGEALRYAQLNNDMVVPTCNFVADFMDEHHEYAKMRVEASQ